MTTAPALTTDQMIHLRLDELRTVMPASQWRRLAAIDARLVDPRQPYYHILQHILQYTGEEIPFNCYLMSRKIHQCPQADARWQDHHLKLHRLKQELATMTDSRIIDTDYDVEAGRARSIIHVEWGPALARILYHGNTPQMLKEGLIDVVTGQPISPRRARARWMAVRDTINAANAAHVQQPSVQALLTYLNNGLQRRDFTFAPAAVEAAWALIHARYAQSQRPAAEVVESKAEKAARLHLYRSAASARNVLNQVLLWPQPLYAQKGHTPRLSAMGLSLCSLPSDVRRVLAPDWLELDLASCHLAVLARLGSATKLLAFLEARNAGTGPGWWDYLAGVMGVTAVRGSAEWTTFKEAMKRVTYAACYGMAAKRLFLPQRKDNGALAEPLSMVAALATITEDQQQAFRADPLVQELLGAVDALRLRIDVARGMPDAWGQMVLLGQDDDDEEGCDSKSVLSQVCQSYELRLLEGVAEAAQEELRKTRPRWRLVLWQHDGISIAVDQDQRARILALLQDRVAATAAVMGFPTRLE